MRIFITGGTGFIGSYFLKQAIAEGHSVKALRRSSDSKPRIDLLNEPEWLEKKLEDITVDDLLGFDVIVHLAASGITPQPATWSDCYSFNVQKSIEFFLTALKAKVPRIVITGSYAEYGRAGLRYDFIPTNAPLEPTDPYAASKASLSVAVNALCFSEKFELVYLRLFSVFGEGQYEKNFWPSLKKAALSGLDFPMTAGEQIRSFIDVGDVAGKLLASCTRKNINPGEPVVSNIGSKSQSLQEFAEYWWKEWGAKGKLLFGAQPYRKDEVMRYVPLLDE